MTGTIEFFNHKRGFGFIKPLVGVGKDCEQVFAHLSSFVYKLGEDTQPLPQGSEVTFELVRRSDGRLQAARVRPVVLGGDSLRRR